MASIPFPPKSTTTRELLQLGRRIERYSAQRRQLLDKLKELDQSIREAKRHFKAIAELISNQELPLEAIKTECWCNRATEPHHYGDELICVAGADSTGPKDRE